MPNFMKFDRSVAFREYSEMCMSRTFIFLPRNNMHSALFVVHLSVAVVYCVETAKDIELYIGYRLPFVLIRRYKKIKRKQPRRDVKYFSVNILLYL